MADVWLPDPEWQPLPAGRGGAVGLWRAETAYGPAVVKRLAPPETDETPERRDQRHYAWWRREALVAESGLLAEAPGLRPPPVLDVQADDSGVTLTHGWVEPDPPPALFVAANLARFAGHRIDDVGWLATDTLRKRLDRTVRRGGWVCLARTPVADLTELLWRRREGHLERLADLPQVLGHTDPVPGNLLARSGDDVVAVDWSMLGWGPVGADLGYLALSAREEFDPLVEAYLTGLRENGGLCVDPAAVRRAAAVTLSYTVATRAEWALAQVAPGDGALAGKFRHPSVAPHLRALQRFLPVIDEVVTG